VATPPSWDAVSRCVNGTRTAQWLDLFRSKRVVFVHLPRTAGTSVEASFFGQDHYSQHLTAPTLRALLGDEIYDGAFTFTFVREPLDRYLSAFFYLLHRTANTPSAKPADVSPHDAIASEMLRRDFHSDPLAYLQHVRSLQLLQLQQPASSREGGAWEGVPLHFRPQTAFLPADGLASLSFVGRFESLRADYARLLVVTETAQAPSTTVGTTGQRAQLVHLRQAVEGRPRLEWARSAELAQLVRLVYAEDYAVLGYTAEEIKPSIGRASDTM